MSNDEALAAPRNSLPFGSQEEEGRPGQIPGSELRQTLETTDVACRIDGALKMSDVYPSGMNTLRTPAATLPNQPSCPSLYSQGQLPPQCNASIRSASYPPSYH